MERLTLLTPPGATQSGTLTLGSPVVTGLSDTSKLVGALGVAGVGVPSGTFVYSIDSATQVTLSQNATAGGSGVSLAFAIEPVSLPEAKLHLRQDIPDDDALIAGLVTSARMHVETALRQALITQTVVLHLDQWPWGGGYMNRQIRQMGPTTPYWLPTSTFPINLFRPPVQSIGSVQYYDYAGNLNTIDPSLYLFEQGSPARISPVFGKVWPVAQPRVGSVQITYTVGYGDTAAAVPEPAKTAMKLMVGAWYENREAVAAGAMAPVPMAVDALLATLDHGSYG